MWQFYLLSNSARALAVCVHAGCDLSLRGIIHIGTQKEGDGLSVSLAGWKTVGAYDQRMILSHAACVFSFLATCTPAARHKKYFLIDSTGRCNNKARRSRKGALGFSEAANRDDRAKPNKHHQREHCKVNIAPSSLYIFFWQQLKLPRASVCPATFSISISLAHLREHFHIAQWASAY